MTFLLLLIVLIELPVIADCVIAVIKAIRGDQ